MNITIDADNPTIRGLLTLVEYIFVDRDNHWPADLVEVGRTAK